MTGLCLLWLAAGPIIDEMEHVEEVEKIRRNV